MANVPSSKKILREKFPSDLKWLTFLLVPLNSFMNDISNAMNKKLNITQNMDGEVKSVIADGIYPIKLAWDRSSRPTVGFIGNIQRTDGSSVALSSAVTLLWSYNQAGQVQIDDVVALDDSTSKKYKLTLVFLVE